MGRRHPTAAEQEGIAPAPCHEDWQVYSISRSTNLYIDAIGRPITFVLGVFSYQRLVNDTGKEEQPPCVQILFPLKEAPYVLRCVKQKLHVGRYGLQYAQLGILYTAVGLCQHKGSRWTEVRAYRHFPQ